MVFNNIDEITQIDTDTYKLENDLDLYSIPLFDPIEEFSGILDGNGYTITGIQEYFIKELTGELKDISVHDSDGPIIDVNEGKIERCSVKNSDVKETTSMTGLICNYNTGEIIDCNSNGFVAGNTVGLISGLNDGEIIDCTASGSVKSSKAGGGICGRSTDESAIRGCSVSADIHAKTQAGGFCGTILGDSLDAEEFRFKNCSFTGQISSDKFCGVFAGFNNGEIIYESCSAIDTVMISSNITVFAGSKYIDCMIDVHTEYKGRLTTERLKEKYDVILKDSDITITIENPEEFSAPRSRSYKFDHSTITIIEVVSDSEVTNEVKLNLEGIENKESSVTHTTKQVNSHTQKVSTEAELRKCSKYDTIVLQNDIFLTESDPLFDVFYGTLDGAECTIKNVQTPCFYALEGTFSNITISRSSIDGKVYYEKVGAIARYNDGRIDTTTLTNSLIESNTTDTGGLVGVSNGTLQDILVKNSVVEGNSSSIGGICGTYTSGESLKVKDSTIVSDNHAGGIAAWGKETSKQSTHLSVDNCIIKGDTSVGGVIGNEQNNNSTHYTVSDTTVIGVENIGGIYGTSRGNLSYGSVKNGTIIGEASVGGCIGKTSNNQNTKYKKCISDCEISGRQNVGGLIGYADHVSIRHCVASGSIEGETVTGGLIGNCISSYIRKSYCDNKITGEDSAAFINQIQRTDVTDCFVLSKLQNGSSIISTIDESSTITVLLWSTVTLPDITSKYGTPVDQGDIHSFKTLVI